MQSDRIRASNRQRFELACWLILFGFCLMLMLVLAAGCKGYDWKRSADSLEVGYWDAHGRSSSNFGGSYEFPYNQDPAFSGTSSGENSSHGTSLSWHPLSGFYDPSVRTVEATDRLYGVVADLRDEMRKERELAKAAELPLTEHAPEPAATGSAQASDGDPVGSAAGSASLPWWKDSAILLVWAGALAALIGGIIKFWPHKKAPSA